MSRILSLVVLIIPLVTRSTVAMATKRPPNVVLILADDLGYECLGAYGGTSYKTPNLDKLAATGMRFERCYAQPVCTPSRVQLLTGIYNVRNYIADHMLETNVVTIANVLKDGGYGIAIAGKWQLSGRFLTPLRFGFEEYCLWQLARRPERYRDPGLELNCKLVDFTNGEYGPDICRDFLCNFISAHRDQSFFAYYPMILPHSPDGPTPDSPDYGRNVHGTKYFAGMVAYMDKEVGELVERLDELGLRDRTLILFSGDNGTARNITSTLGKLKIAGGKNHADDGGMHVPLIANWPGVVPAGKACPSLIDFTDFMPTICEAAGVSVPKELNIDGQSFLPQLRGETGNPRQWIYCWFNQYGGEIPKDEFARDERYRLDRDGTFTETSANGLKQRTIDVSSMNEKELVAHKKLQVALDKYKAARPAEVATWTLTHETTKMPD
jgi:arylsulfatase A